MDATGHHETFHRAGCGKADLHAVVGGETSQGTSGHVFDIRMLHSYAYLLKLQSELNLTNGRGQIHTPYIWNEIAFCAGKTDSSFAEKTGVFEGDQERLPHPEWE